MVSLSNLSSYIASSFWIRLVSGIAFCLLSVAVYRVYFHPLSKYPGPLSSKISSWANWLHAAQGHRHLELARQHTKYGPILRIGPNALSFNTAEALQDIYAAPSRKSNLIKGHYYETISTAEGGKCTAFSTRSPAEHAQKRRLLSQAFSDAALRDSESQILTQVRKWAEVLTGTTKTANDEGGDKGRDMAYWSDLLTVDVLSDLCFGKPFNVVESEDNRYAITLIGQSIKAGYIVGHFPFKILRWLLFASPLAPIVGGQIIRDHLRLQAFCAEAVVERHQKSQPPSSSSASVPEGKKDFFEHLFSGTDPTTNTSYASLPPTALLNDSIQLLIAGSDTSSTTLAALFFHLTRPRHAHTTLQKLTADIRAAFPGGKEDIRGKEVTAEKMPFLRACIDETMRLAPPVPAHLPREVLPGGAVVDGIFLPAGTEVGVTTYAIHHNPAYFPDPYVFRPERWLAGGGGGGGQGKDSSPERKREEEEVMMAAQNSAFCPFSLGQRGCVGKGLAYLEISLAVCWLLYGWDVEAVEGSEKGQSWAGEGGKKEEEEFQLHDYFICHREGPMVRFRKRVGVGE